MNMIRLTNAEDGRQDKPIAINAQRVVTVLSFFDNETRIWTDDGREHIVSESYDDVLSALAIRE